MEKISGAPEALPTKIVSAEEKAKISDEISKKFTDRNFGPENFNELLEELVKKGVIKKASSPGNIKFLEKLQEKDETVRIIQSISTPPLAYKLSQKGPSVYMSFAGQTLKSLAELRKRAEKKLEEPKESEIKGEKQVGQEKKVKRTNAKTRKIGKTKITGEWKKIVRQAEKDLF